MAATAKNSNITESVLWELAGFLLIVSQEALKQLVSLVEMDAHYRVFTRVKYTCARNWGRGRKRGTVFAQMGRIFRRAYGIIS